MIGLFTEMPAHVGKKPRKMYEDQNGKCATCQGKLSNRLFSRWFRCRYTGALYCPNCHDMQKRPMPWRLVGDLNPRPSYVCRFAQEYLDNLALVPMLSMDRLRPGFPVGSPGFEDIHQLRKRLAKAKVFLSKCHEGERVVNAYLAQHDTHNDRQHLLKDGPMLYMYSLRDLVQGIDGRLIKWLRECFDTIVKHKDTCGICVHFCRMSCVCVRWAMLCIDRKRAVHLKTDVS